MILWLTFRFHENEKEALKREQVRDKRKVLKCGLWRAQFLDLTDPKSQVCIQLEEVRIGPFNSGAKSWGPDCPCWYNWQEPLREELSDGNNVCYVVSTFQFGYMVSKFYS